MSPHQILTGLCVFRQTALYGLLLAFSILASVTQLGTPNNACRSPCTLVAHLGVIARRLCIVADPGHEDLEEEEEAAGFTFCNLLFGGYGNFPPRTPRFVRRNCDETFLGVVCLACACCADFNLKSEKVIQLQRKAIYSSLATALTRVSPASQIVRGLPAVLDCSARFFCCADVTCALSSPRASIESLFCHSRRQKKILAEAAKADKWYQVTPRLIGYALSVAFMVSR
jgi:hypothetical protein